MRYTCATHSWFSDIDQCMYCAGAFQAPDAAPADGITRNPRRAGGHQGGSEATGLGVDQEFDTLNMPDWKEWLMIASAILVLIAPILYILTRP